MNLPKLRRQRPAFTLVPERLLYDPTLSMGAKALYAILARHADADGALFPGMARLAMLTGCRNETVRKYRHELESRGWLVNEGQSVNGTKFTSNSYMIMEEPSEAVFPVHGKTRHGNFPARAEASTNESQSFNERKDIAPAVRDASASNPPQSLLEGLEQTPAPKTRPKSKASPGTGPGVPSRPRNEAWDALVEIEGGAGGQVNAFAAGRIGKALKVIRGVCPLVNGELAAEIRRRAANYRKAWPKATLSSTALASHWERMDKVATQVSVIAARDQNVGADQYADEFAAAFGQGGGR